MSRLTHRDPNRAALLSRNSSNRNTQTPITNQTQDNYIPNYGRSSYGSPYTTQTSLLASTSNSSFSNNRTAEELESQNDEAIEGLSAKVKMLKEITVNIGTEVKESSKFIAGMNDTFSEASGMLSGTFKKMNRMAEKQVGRWWYWLLFLIVVFWIFVFTWLWRH